MPPDISTALDAWIAEQMDPRPSRPEAIRRILTDHLKEKGYLPR
jgi:hypothetical protein